MIEKTDQQWREQLTPEQYKVTRLKGTEAPFSGEYIKTDDRGVYHCICCDAPLFSSDTKYHSGCGWPSFFAAVDTVGYRPDDSHGMHRTEIFCKNCDAHLGHVFEDGPNPTGQRYCVNSVSIKLKKEG